MITMLLVGGFNPSENDARQIGSSPQIENKIKDIRNHDLLLYFEDHPI